MEHVQSFKDFLNENVSGEEVQETVEIKKKPGFVWMNSPTYDFAPVMSIIKSFRKPNLKSIEIYVEGIAKINIDASGIRTEPISSNTRKGINKGESLEPGTKYFNAQGGSYANLWYNLPKFEAIVGTKLASILRLEFMYKIKWPIEVPIASENNRGGAWARENVEFNPINDEADFWIWLSQFPQVPVKQGVAMSSDESKKAVEDVIKMSPNTISVTITGFK